MDFKQKIDNILNTNDLGISSVHALEKFVGVATGTISAPYREGREPGKATIKKIKKSLGIPDDEWVAGDFGIGDGEDPKKKLQKTMELLVASKNEEILRLVNTQKWMQDTIDALTAKVGPVEQAKK